MKLRNVVSGFLLFAASVFSQENYSQWLYSKSITVNTSATGANVATDQVNFPVLVRLTSANSDMFRLASPTGADLRFAKNDGTHLKYQIERWSAIASDTSATIWVLMDTVYGNNSSQSIRMYWGKSGAADSSKGTAVFSSTNNFQGVYHMTSTTELNTVNAVAGTLDLKAPPTNPTDLAPTVALSNVGQGLVFNGVGTIGASSAATINSSKTNAGFHFLSNSRTAQYTLSAWVKNGTSQAATLGMIVCKSAQYYLGIRNNSGTYQWEMAEYTTSTGTDKVASNVVATADGWNHVVGVRNGATTTLYINGVSAASTTFSGSSGGSNYLAGGTFVQTVGIGRDGGGTTTDNGVSPTASSYFKGSIDELHVESTVRSADWVKLSYETQKSGTTAVTLGATQTEDYTQWSASKAVTVNTTSLGLSASVTNFPMLVRLTSSDAAVFSNVLGTNGGDIRFTKADGITPLAYHRERWDAVNQLAEFWVLMDTVQANASTGIRIYWGKSGVPDGSNSQATFQTTNGFAGVWHMEGDSSNVSDATANGFAGTKIGTVTDSVGAIGRGRYFTGTSNNFIRITHSGQGYSVAAKKGLLDSVMTSFTISAWFNANNWTGNPRLICRGSTGIKYAFQDTSGGLFYNVNTNTTLQPRTSSAPTTSAWHLVHGTYNPTGTVVSYYMDGQFVGSVVKARATDNSPFDLVIGGRNTFSGDGTGTNTADHVFNGILDEVRVQSTTRDSNWIKLDYATQRAGQSVVTGTAAPPAPTNLSYSSPVTYGQNVAITASSPTVTGTVSSYSITPDLNANTGLSFNTSTGIISGTPTKTSSATDYTVTATNSTGSTQATLNVQVNGFAYTGSVVTYKKNVTITDNPLTSSTGSYTGFSVSPNLATNTGLSFNTSTGAITGAPTTASSTITYTVTGTFSGGTATSTVNIRVEGEDYSLWNIYKSVNINTSSLSLTGAVTNFPTLVRLTSGDADVFNNALVAKGGDIRFTKADGVTHLPYQRERWDAVNKVAEFWVLMDTVKSGASTGIRMYWGKSGAVDSSNGRAVFDTANKFVGVWHMEGDSSNVADATGMGFYGANTGTTNATGTVGIGRSFVRTSPTVGQFIRIFGSGSNNRFDLNMTQTTISLWVNGSDWGSSTADRAKIICRGTSSFKYEFQDTTFDGGATYGMWWGVNPTAGNNGSLVKTSGSLSTGTWHLLHGTFNPSANNISLYLDGAFVGSVAGSAAYASSPWDVHLGARGFGSTPEPNPGSEDHFFNGMMDEVRMQGVARNADWVALDYATQKSDQTTVTGTGSVGTAQTAPSNLSYSGSSVVYIVGGAITANAPAVTGAVTLYSITPDLIANTGLSFDTSTGVISGIPTKGSPTTSYTITAANSAGSTTANVSVTTYAPPVIAYKQATLSATRNVTITPDTVSSTGGPVTGYAMTSSTPLPAGLLLDSLTGLISGTPTVVSNLTADTIAATGPGGMGKAVVTVVVSDSAPSISYKQAAISAIKNVAIVPDTVVVTGTGAITGYTVSLSLPAGLHIDSLTGLITGIPTSVTSSVNDTVIATGPGGTGRTVVTIAVVDTAPSVSYKQTSIFGIKNVAITPDTVVMMGTGAITSYTVNPSLPAGLHIDSLTGVISGIPTSVTSSMNDTVNATGPGGTGKIVLNVSVADTAPAIAYKRTTISGFKNVSITPDTVVSTGGAITGYAMSSSTPLPSGLSLNAANGIISGVPLVTASVVDTIIATGPGGTGATVVTLTVTPGAEDYTQWSNQKDITLNTTSTGANVSGTVTKFPMLVRLTSGNFTDFSIPGTKASLRFIRGTTQLKYQVERFDSTGGQAAEIWVKLDTVFGNNATQSFRMYWGKSGAPDSSNGRTVFDTANGFQGVYHMSSATELDNSLPVVGTLDLKAPPTNPSDLAPTVSTGTVGQGLVFNGNGAIGSSSAATINSSKNNTGFSFVTDRTSHYTLSAWIKKGASQASTLGMIVCKSAQYYLGINGTTNQWEMAEYTTTNGTDKVDANTVSTSDGWNHVVGVRNGSTTTLYVNGVSAASTTFSGSSGGSNYLLGGTKVQTVGIGRDGGGSISDNGVNPTSSSYFKGSMDELHVENVSRSADWVKLSYETQKSNATTLGVGAPVIAYNRTNISGTRNVVIIPDTILSTGGSITSFALSSGSTLPAGLSLDVSTGVIAGTPTVVGSSVSDTVVATGPLGTGSTVVTIAVADTAPAFSYARTSISGMKNVAIAPDTVMVTGSGAITSYAVSPSLPSGLSLNTSTGLITGTPTSVTSSVNDTVTATGPGGTGKVVLSIVISDTAPSISYTRTTISAVKNVPMTPDTVVMTGTGSITSYSVSPSLPAGLHIDSLTGIVSGTATVATTASDTVMATGPGGSGKFVLSIAVSDTAPSISYKRVTISAVKNVIITPDTVVMTGTGAITSYAVNPALPAGLHIDSLTGLITGTPASVMTSVNDTVTATGPGGTGKTVVMITVQDTAPKIAYRNNPVTYGRNVAITPDSIVSTGGAITGYAVSPALPAGLTLNASTGVISGAPTVVTASTNDTITATGPGGTGKVVLTITVLDTAPAFSYKRASISGVRNVVITPDTVVSTGGAITSYAMVSSTPLPAGLSLNASNGIISGAPTALTGATVDTIIATGPSGTGRAVVTIAVVDTSPAISYKRTTISAVKNVIITPDTVIVTGTGAITGYSVSPSLPTGLHIDSLTGLITGTPTSVIASVNDTVTATGPGGSGKFVLNISVSDTSPSISYKRLTITAVKNVAITPDTMVVIGSGAITAYNVSPALPSGLSLNASTGLITGTPTSVTASVNDTVTATGPGGIGKVVLTVSVGDTAPAFSYKRSSISGIRNTAIVPDTVVVTGTGSITSYAMSSSTPLPTGLSLNTSSGIISGMPTSVLVSTADTIIATGPGGTGRAVLTIAVQDTAPKISYRNNPATYAKNVVITPDSIVSTGGAITGYSVSPALPAGLSLNTSTGVISGTPTLVTSTVNDTITATGPGGTGKVVLTITVADTAPAFSYKRSNISGVRNVSITPDTVVSTGGAITGYAMASSTPLPTGLSLNASSGVISGTPTSVLASTADTIIATGPSGTGRAMLTIAVSDTSPSITYKRLTVTSVKNVSITPDTVVVTGSGSITSYAVSPVLPAGLTLNTSTGLITGTPTSVTSLITDTVTATGPGGTGKVVLSITVSDTAPAISYKRTTISAIKNVAITPDTVVVTGSGSITGYAVSPVLPTGLNLNTSTGLITGTPTSVTSSVNDTVTATGPGGTGKVVLSIVVADTAPSISYKRLTISAVKNVGIIPDTVMVAGSGAITGYALSHALPSGLNFNTSTGLISGTSTVISPASFDTVTATGPGGTGKVVLSVAVSDTVPSLSYKRLTISAVKNVGITPDTVMVTGSGAITSYAVSPALPSGLTLNASTGLITGTPTSVTSSVNDTVTATGPGGTGKAVVTISVTDTAPAFMYKRSGISGIKNVAITPDTVMVTGSGAITSYVLSHALPSGLNFSTSTGLISGTSTVTATASNDTVTATGPGGSVSVVLTIAISDTSPSISYKRVTIAATKNVAVLPDTVVVTGSGAITSYAVNPALPVGLTLNTSTGLITGTPTSVTSAVNDTVTATGPGGTGKVVLTITVADTAPSFTYKRSSISGIRNVAITPDTVVSTGGAITSYAIASSTPLPAGLSLNTSSGIIAGVPTSVSASSVDTIIATGPSGTGRAVMTIAVQDTAPKISYRNNPVTYAKNVVITPDSVVSTGGAITGYSVSPALPAGLSLNTSTGLISGTPTLVTSTVNDTITATGPGGTGKVVLTITVADTAPAFSYKRSSIFGIRNVSITPDTVVSTGGAITSYAMASSTPLPTGFSLNISSGIISGVPTSVSVSALDTIVATGPSGTGRAVVTIAVSDTSPSITYKRLTLSGIKNVVITPDTVVVTGTGAITAFSVNPSLPAGLYIDSLTGLITGTPTSVIASMNDTVTATGPGGTGRVVLSITVSDTAPAISYKRTTISAIKNVVITPDTVVVTGTGAIASYALSHALPSGLSFSTSTGLISGTPTVILASSFDTVTATGPGGAGKVVLTISVSDTAPAFTYKRSSISGIKNVVITPDTVVVTGTGSITSYAMASSTPLPTGFDLNTSSGIISGMPTSVLVSTADTVIATGPGGTGRTVVTIAVQDTAPKISYRNNPVTYAKNVAITPDSIVSTGGAITGYSVSPALPAGLSLNTSTGVISGTPAVVTATMNDTITATGPGGTGKVILTMTVSDTSPAFSYKRGSISGVKNVAITSDTVVPTGGAITSYAMASSTPLPAGLILNTSSGIISGVPTLVSVSTLDTIIATGSSGTGRTVVTIAVADTSPSITYKLLTISGIKNAVITPDTVVVTGTGAIASYAVSPALPAGLNLDTSTGLITGTPTSVTSFVSDTVTATGPGGTGRVILTITVSDAAPVISYKQTTLNAVKNMVIVPDTVVSIGGAITSYTVSPSLPAGLHIDSLTGLLTGTPTSVTSVVNDTITATGPGGTGMVIITITVADTAPVFTYKRSSISGVKNVAITPDTVLLTGGAITTYAMAGSTPLPAGLSLNTFNGIISGVPISVSVPAVDTIIATGPGGTGRAMVTIAISDTAPSISYTTATLHFVRNGISEGRRGVLVLPPDTVVSTGGSVTSYHVLPILPSGLALDTVTGIISGTPSAISAVALTNYTVTASGPGGSGQAVVGIAIVDTVPAISYFRSSISVIRNSAITPDTVLFSISSGVVDSFTVSPALPAGLSFSKTTGDITGTPTVASATSNYTVTADGPGGTGISVVSIGVVDLSPVISYQRSSISAIKSIMIPADSVLASGGTIDSFTVSPALPAGLSLGSTTGLLTGIPTAAATPAAYTVTAMGPGGSGIFVLNIDVADSTPIIAYKQGSISGVKGVSILPDTIVSTGGSTTVYRVSPSLPAGLSLDTLTGRISGIPATPSAAGVYVVTGTGFGGSDTAQVNVMIQDTAPRIAYIRLRLVLARNAAMVSDTLLSTGGGVTVYHPTHALPAGMTLDTVSGIISGTPSVQVIGTNDTVIATGPGGTGVSVLNISVYAVPNNLSYADDPATYVLGVALPTPNAASVSGIITRFTVNPALPSGLVLDSISGNISGTPTGTQHFGTDYTVTAGNPVGFTTGTVNIGIVGPPSNLSYTDDVPTYAVNQAIVPPNTPTVHGIVTFYTITPPLPAGVSFDQTTGYIQGTPAAASPSTDYTITGANPGGSSSTTIHLTVIAP